MPSVPNTGVKLVSEQVFGRLLEALLSGQYVAGEKLPNQRALAADLGVTMSSLREALKRLEQMRLIEVRHGDAMRVRDWRAHGGLDVLAHVLLRGGGVDAAVLGDVLEARSLMLREIAGLAAERADAEQARRLEDLAERFAATGDDALAAAHVDFAFMAELAQVADNLVFVLVLNAIRGLYFDHLALIPVTARPAELAPLYTSIARAVGRGEVAPARSAALELATLQRERVEAALPSRR